jgi:phosphopantetheinyl transferase (holo-ACP synthase)
MPISKYIDLNDHSNLALWRIDENYDELMALVNLHENDETLLQSISNEHKKLEWLSSRLSVKFLVEKYNLAFNGIKKDSFNKPYLKSYNYEISLTHSYPYAGAIFHFTDPVGIDVELPREKIRNIAPRFLHPEELEYAGNDLDLLTILWSAKETLYKIYGRQKLVFKEHLFIPPFNRHINQQFEGEIKLPGIKKSNYRLKFETIGNHYVVFNI